MSTPTSAPQPSRRAPSPPLYVDLDRVLLTSGLTLECLVEALRRRPVVFFLLPLWALRGRAFLKSRLARTARLDPARLQYRAEAVAELRRRAEAGVILGLVTAADESAARPVAEHLGIFGDVVSSTVAGLGSRRVRRELARRHGPDGYEFLTGRRPVPSPSVMWKLLRPHQWLKNTLVFLPFLLAHHIRSAHAWAMACLAFAAFSMCASGCYVMNDILDRYQDRLHPRKRFRPLAAGAVPLDWSLWMMAALLAVAALCSWLLPWPCAVILVWYLGATSFYSAVAKDRLMADVIILALLYTTRLVMGSHATGNVVSPWLASFSMMLFLSLALCKRVSELMTWKSIQYGSAPGRKYSADDIPVLEMMAVASGFVACLVMVLYLQSEDILRLYRHPEYLWVGAVGLLYWLGRLMLYTHRGKCPDDPLFFVLQDKTTLLVLGVAGVFAVLAV